MVHPRGGARLHRGDHEPEAELGRDARAVVEPERRRFSLPRRLRLDEPSGPLLPEPVTLVLDGRPGRAAVHRRHRRLVDGTRAQFFEVLDEPSGGDGEEPGAAESAELGVGADAANRRPRERVHGSSRVHQPAVRADPGRELDATRERAHGIERGGRRRRRRSLNFLAAFFSSIRRGLFALGGLRLGLGRFPLLLGHVRETLRANRILGLLVLDQPDGGVHRGVPRGVGRDHGPRRERRVPPRKHRRQLSSERPRSLLASFSPRHRRIPRAVRRRLRGLGFPLLCLRGGLLFVRGVLLGERLLGGG